MESFNWVCPFCNHACVVTNNNSSEYTTHLSIDNADGDKFLTSSFIVCPNPDCKKYSLTIGLGKASFDGRCKYGDLEKIWHLIPPSNAKVFPSYIPTALLDDYNEACQNRELSPKSSATLARRCLQGMIRDFWGISKNRLVDEIEALKDKIDPITWKAIDAIRQIGNIGAHMGQDINLIVDVDPTEASVLISLIEQLFKDWYIHRYERQKALEEVVEIAKRKNETRSEGYNLFRRPMRQRA